jgi:hypothetical protein
MHGTNVKKMIIVECITHEEFLLPLRFAILRDVRLSQEVTSTFEVSGFSGLVD